MPRTTSSASSTTRPASSRRTSKTRPADFVKVAQDSKVITDVTVTATAVESMTTNRPSCWSRPPPASPIPRAPNRSRAHGGCRSTWNERRRTGQDGESRVRAVTDEDKNDDRRRADARREQRGRRAHRAPSTITETSDRSPRTPTTRRSPTMRARAGSPAVDARRRPHIGAILVAVALVASAGVAGWLYFYQYRLDQQTNAAATNVALEAAKNGTVALLSYSPDTLDKDFAAAKSNLTGDFLSYYTQFTEQIVTPAAKEKQVKTAASVRSGRGVRNASGLRRLCWCSSTRSPPARRTRTARSRRAASRSA